MTSMVELECPVFIGDTNGAVGEVKQRNRHVTRRVDGLEGRTESIEERLDRLEAENQDLRAKVEAKTEIDVTELVSWLAGMVKEHVERQMPTIPVSVRGAQYALPEPVANMIIDVAAVEKAVVPKRGKKKKSQPAG
jgi:hypothetical protein